MVAHSRVPVRVRVRISGSGSGNGSEQSIARNPHQLRIDPDSDPDEMVQTGARPSRPTKASILASSVVSGGRAGYGIVLHHLQASSAWYTMPIPGTPRSAGERVRPRSQSEIGTDRSQVRVGRRARSARANPEPERSTSCSRTGQQAGRRRPGSVVCVVPASLARPRCPGDAGTRPPSGGRGPEGRCCGKEAFALPASNPSQAIRPTAMIGGRDARGHRSSTQVLRSRVPYRKLPVFHEGRRRRDGSACQPQADALSSPRVRTDRRRR